MANSNKSNSNTSSNSHWHNDHHHIDVGDVHLLLNPCDPYEMDEYIRKQVERSDDVKTVEEFYIKNNLTDPSDPSQMFNFVMKLQAAEKQQMQQRQHQ